MLRQRLLAGINFVDDGGEQPCVRTRQAKAPARARMSSRYAGHDLEIGFEVELVAAEQLWSNDPIEPCVTKNPMQVLGVVAALSSCWLRSTGISSPARAISDSRVTIASVEYNVVGESIAGISLWGLAHVSNFGRETQGNHRHAAGAATRTDPPASILASIKPSPAPTPAPGQVDAPTK